MLFASFDFVLFFLPVLLAYWALARYPVARWLLLLCSSYFFYCASARPPSGGWPTPWYFVGLIVASTVVDYLVALGISSTRQRFWRNACLGVSLVGNLGMLGYFKYSGFLLDVARDLSHALGLGGVALPTLRVALPIGISFYTFQSLSYTIDVWRGRIQAERSLLRFACYVAFFPQLVAGPIVRASEFMPQLRAPLRVDIEDVNVAVFRITKGLFKKVVLGDFVAANFTDLVFASPTQYSSLETLLALYAFTLQIYADFSGYSDMAIGVARLLGFKLPENFDRPYQSRDVGEFWRRWHMTLSTWLRDYVFFPLGGSRGSEKRTYFNLWLTMVLVGIWHGASWNFVIYGNLHAAALLYSRFNRMQAQRGEVMYGLMAVAASLFLAVCAVGLGLLLELPVDSALLMGAIIFAIAVINGILPVATDGPVWSLVHLFLTFQFTALSRVFFRADSLAEAGQMTVRLVQWDSLGVREGLFRMQGLHAWASDRAASLGDLAGPLLAFSEWGVLIVIALGLGYHLLPARWSDGVGQRITRSLPAPAIGVALAGSMFLMSRLLDGPRANIYFSF
ncbi:MAG TPA: MBOAT family protein [Polyangiaceae bacterium]|jgi:D-alanyl-lipoteichoic acid acyltransferase DltB (MBOAT superfamily)|nr:MBOAT family protein [Polyangiaceae bacterium]